MCNGTCSASVGRLYALIHAFPHTLATWNPEFFGRGTLSVENPFRIIFADGSCLGYHTSIQHPAAQRIDQMSRNQSQTARIFSCKERKRKRRKPRTIGTKVKHLKKKSGGRRQLQQFVFKVWYRLDNTLARRKGTKPSLNPRTHPLHTLGGDAHSSSVSPVAPDDVQLVHLSSFQRQTKS